MKKVLFVTTAITLILAGTAFADDPVQGWLDVMEEVQVRSSSQDVEYDDARGAVINVITRSGGNEFFGTVIRANNESDGALLSQYLKEIDDRHTVAKAACGGGEPGEYVTTGYHDNETNPVFWSAGWEAQGDSTAWVKDVFSESETMEQGQYIYRDDEGNYYAVGTTWNVETGGDVTIIKYNSNLEKVWRTTVVDSGYDYVYGIDVSRASTQNKVYFVAEKLTLPDSYSTYLRSTSADNGITDPNWVYYGVKMVDTDDMIPAGASFKSTSPYQAADDTCFYIAATVLTSSGADIWTACCDYDGNYLWEKVFDSGYDDEAHDICMGFGYVYVVGSSGNGTDKDARMIRYDEAGNETWNVVYDDGADEALYSICLDPAGNFYVGGYTEEDTVPNALLIKYSQPDVVGIEEHPSSEPSSPSSVTLEVLDNPSTSPTIHYSLPQGERGTLTFYSADGRKLESYNLDPAQSALTWSTRNTPSGVYFVKLRVGRESITQRLILTK